MGLPSGFSFKEYDCDEGVAEDTGSILGLRRSPEGEHRNPLQYSCLENSVDREASGFNSPWGHKELDMTEAT